MRPDHPRLLPARLHASGQPAEHPRPTAVLLHANGILPGDVPPRDPVAPARSPAQPVPARPTALPPDGEPLDDGRDPARGQPQPAERAAPGALGARVDRDPPSP